MDDEQIEELAESIRDQFDGIEPPDISEITEAIRTSQELFVEMAKVITDSLIPAVNEYVKALKAIGDNRLRRYAAKQKRGNPSNNYRKMHGQPMYRWRWLK